MEMYNYATENNQKLILEEIQQVNDNMTELLTVQKNMNQACYCILFLIVLNLTIEIVKKALYTR